MELKIRKPDSVARPKVLSASILVIAATAGDWRRHEKHLTSAGFHVETVTFGPIAAKRLNGSDHDLVIIDGSAAPAAAQTLLTRIRQSPSGHAIRVILVTADADSDAMVMALENGADDCVGAPIDMPVLTARVRARLADKALAQAPLPERSGPRRSVDWLELVMDSATVAIFETDHLGIVRRMNQAACQLTGGDASDLIGETLGSIFSDESNADISALLARVAADGYFVSNHPAHLRDDLGGARVLSVSLRRIGDAGSGNGVVVTAEDMTETWQRRSASLSEPAAPIAEADIAPAPTPSKPKTKTEPIVDRAVVNDGHDERSDGQSNKRARARKRVFKGAKLCFNNDTSLVDCVVKDISETGARLAFQGVFDCPRLVRLRVSDGQTYDCEVRWFTNKMMGVNFLAAPNPEAG